MDSFSLEVWIGRQLRDVEEDGSACSRLQIVSAETREVFQTWKAPFNEPLLIQEVEQLLEILPNELPVGAQQVLLIASDADGADLARLPRTLRGKNKNAATNLLKTEGELWLTRAMGEVGEVLKALTSLTNTQVAVSMRREEQSHKALAEMYEYTRSMQEREILSREQQVEEAGKADALSEAFAGFLKNDLGDAIALLKSLSEKKAPASEGLRAVGELKK